MEDYEEARVALTKNEFNMLKSSANNETETTLRITNKNFHEEELPHKLLLGTSQKQKNNKFFCQQYVN